MEPSDGAVAAAYELVCATREGDGEIAVTFGEAAQFFSDESEAEGFINDLRGAVAVALDDHTAALRAEVEALRAEIAGTERALRSNLESTKAKQASADNSENGEVEAAYWRGRGIGLVFALSQLPGYGESK